MSQPGASGQTSDNQWPKTVPEMASKATAMARAKLPDAVLIEVTVDPRPESFGPAPDGSLWSLSFTFYSPSQQSTYLITPYNPAGEEWQQGQYDLSDREPLPAQFLDFADAVKKAQEMGMQGKAQRGYLAARPKAPMNEKADLTWTIWPVNADRVYNVPATEFVPNNGPSTNGVASKVAVATRLLTGKPWQDEGGYEWEFRDDGVLSVTHHEADGDVITWGQGFNLVGSELTITIRGETFIYNLKWVDDHTILLTLNDGNNQFLLKR
jgi:hypothetical protein